MAELNEIQKNNIILTGLRKLQVIFQLPEPEKSYIDSLRELLHKNKWKGNTEFIPVCDLLLVDSEYAKNASFGKYPSYFDFERNRNKLTKTRLTEFKEYLSGTLNGNWWMIKSFIEWCNQYEIGAIKNSGGIEELYARANREEYQTPISKLIDEVIENFKEIQDGAKVIEISQRTNTAIGLSDAIKQIGRE